MALREDAKIELSPEQRAELEKAARSRRTAQAVAQRARIVLLTAEGLSPSVIGEQLGVSQPTIRKWRARYQECGLAGLRTEARPGRPRTLDDQRVADLLNRALQTRPAKQTHWSVRSFAAEAGISKDMAHRLFRARAWRKRLGNYIPPPTSDGIFLRSGASFEGHRRRPVVRQ